MNKYNNEIRYIYSAAGEKLRVTHLTAVPNITVPIGTARELVPSEILSADSTDYLLGGTLTMRNGRIDRYLFDEGYCQAAKYASIPVQDTFTFYYFDRDHLGSVRQVVKADRNTNGTVVQRMEYYPSGLQFCNNVTDSDVQPRRYNGKELDRMHGLNTYDYGARQYNPVTARWDRVDPLCEKYYSVSPYAYCGGNPMNFIDPNGCDSIFAQSGDFIGDDGKIRVMFIAYQEVQKVPSNQQQKKENTILVVCQIWMKWPLFLGERPLNKSKMTTRLQMVRKKAVAYIPMELCKNGILEHNPLFHLGKMVQ